MTKKRLMVALVTVVLSAGALGACGSSQSSAAAQVCTDGANLHKAVDGVVTDLKDLNLGKAKDGLSSVNDAFDQLKKSASQLKAEEAKSPVAADRPIEERPAGLEERAVAERISSRLEQGNDPVPVPLHANHRHSEVPVLSGPSVTGGERLSARRHA